ncbi:hypothetical protein [Desulfopila sp. IMCC35008]|uniref:hypothetical protein n=1 Tax=Desulfopila sp. IMCC35008 TaxID=2653858 RepID=UPI002714D4D9|nr:hypothetical protein [Desulfopila sp. IMCC35008]
MKYFLWTSAASIVNDCFLAMIVANGFDPAIMNPLDKDIMALVTTADMIAGDDDYYMLFIKETRAGTVVSHADDCMVEGVASWVICCIVT